MNYRSIISDDAAEPRLRRVAVRRGFRLFVEVRREVRRRHVYFVERRARERADELQCLWQRSCRPEWRSFCGPLWREAPNSLGSAPALSFADPLLVFKFLLGEGTGGGVWRPEAFGRESPPLPASGNLRPRLVDEP